MQLRHRWPGFAARADGSFAIGFRCKATPLEAALRRRLRGFSAQRRVEVIRQVRHEGENGRGATGRSTRFYAEDAVSAGVGFGVYKDVQLRPLYENGQGAHTSR
jgi:hypothetical protein